MIQHPSFRGEPWSLHETTLDLEALGQSESLFALSNGHIGLHGKLVRLLVDDEPFDYAAEASLIDVQDLQHNVSSGLHIASLAGSWIAFVNGFGGLRDHGDCLEFAPRLPESVSRLTFLMVHRNQSLRVSVTARSATYSLIDHEGALRIKHYGDVLTLTGASPIERPIPPLSPHEPPTQPPGREPRHRSPG
jgi:alpha,alpha-trehalose phosphorylase